MSPGVRSNNIWEVSFRRGKTLINIKQAINKEQIGSAIFHPKFSISKDDMMTPTLPSVSAKTCKNTPEKLKKTAIHTLYE